jgi:hypothetical protein
LYRKFLLLPASLLLSACVAATPAPMPTLTPEPTSTLAPATVLPTVWFPPTATFTPFPTPERTPTEAIEIEYGPVLFQDDFSDPSQWESRISGEGKASLANNEMAIVITEPHGFYFSLRRAPDLGDFYLEITASPTLCMGEDEYGLMLRVASEGDYYRYSLSCDGQVRLDRIYKGGAGTLVDWKPGAGVPPGAPSSARLGVRMQGEEMRFFVDGLEQFSISDPLLPIGRVGLFGRSASENAVTVGFSDLVVYGLGSE